MGFVMFSDTFSPDPMETFLLWFRPYQLQYQLFSNRSMGDWIPSVVTNRQMFNLNTSRTDQRLINLVYYVCLGRIGAISILVSADYVHILKRAVEGAFRRGRIYNDDNGPAD